MRTAGRLLLLFSIAWAASWGTPACAAEQEGSPVRLVPMMVAAETLREMRPGIELPAAHVEVAEAVSEPLPSEAFGRAPAKNAGSEPPLCGRAALARLRTTPFLSSDILLLIQRQNE